MSTSRSTPMALGSLYTKYIQKSYAFLFPWLELKARGPGVILPERTYLRVKGIFQPDDHKLICCYDKPADDAAWIAYQAKHLLTHPLLDTSVATTDPDRMLYIFDLNYYQQDIVYFLQGRYSQLSPRVKQLICSYYGVESKNWAYLESFLYPDKFFPQYAKLLDIPEDELREGGELCDVFNKEKETFPGELPDSFVDDLSML